MFIKSGAIISEVFNIAKTQKNSGPQEMFSKSGCLVYPLTLFRASTVLTFTYIYFITYILHFTYILLTFTYIYLHLLHHDKLLKLHKRQTLETYCDDDADDDAFNNVLVLVLVLVVSDDRTIFHLPRANVLIVTTLVGVIETRVQSAVANTVADQEHGDVVASTTPELIEQSHQIIISVVFDLYFFFLGRFRTVLQAKIIDHTLLYRRVIDL